jgi:hypothetical protein
VEAEEIRKGREGKGESAFTPFFFLAKKNSQLNY